MNVKKIFKKMSGLEDKPTIKTSEVGDLSKVKIYNENNKPVGEKVLSDKERRAIEMQSVIDLAHKAGHYLVCLTIYDPDNKTGRTKNGNDLHHFAFRQDFKDEDRYGCLDEYAKLLQLGDR